MNIMPSGVGLVGYVNGVSLTAAGHAIEILENLINPKHEYVKQWTEKNYWSFAFHKFETIILEKITSLRESR